MATVPSSGELIAKLLATSGLTPHPRAGVRVVKDNVEKVGKSVVDLTHRRVLVGIPETTSARHDPKGRPITNAALGYIHENGAPEVNIPARPWLVPGVRSGQEQFEPHLREAAKAALAGDKRAMEEELNSAGIEATSAVRIYFNTAAFVPLKPATIAARRRRGHFGTRPLIDSAQLRNAITYVIRDAS